MFGIKELKEKTAYEGSRVDNLIATVREMEKRVLAKDEVTNARIESMMEMYNVHIFDLKKRIERLTNQLAQLVALTGHKITPPETAKDGGDVVKKTKEDLAYENLWRDTLARSVVPFVRTPRKKPAKKSRT